MFFILPIEESSQVMGFAVGLSRLNSLELTRESRRERTITRQNSITPDPEDEDLPKVFPKKIREIIITRMPSPVTNFFLLLLGQYPTHYQNQCSRMAIHNYGWISFNRYVFKYFNEKNALYYILKVSFFFEN